MSVASLLGFEFGLFRYDPREWMVMTGDRRLVSLAWLGLLAALFIATVHSGQVPLEKETPILFLLFALIGGNFTLIAIVTSLSQFVLGRRLESPDEIRTKIRETIAYRDDVATNVRQGVLPVTADAFFLVLYENAREECEQLERAKSEGRTKVAHEELNELVNGLQTHIEYIIDILRRPSSGMKHALFISLTVDNENFVHRTWYLQSEHSHEFTRGAAEPLGKLVDTLKHIEVAPRMFKTVFIESEISELSRVLLYVGLPVQVTAVLVTLLYSAPGTAPPLPVSVLEWVIPAVLTAGFAPFVILSAYVVRLTVVARRTADSFPFSSHLTGGLGIEGDDRF